LGLGQDSFTTGLPVTITGGFNNPDQSLRNVSGIHRSDSVVTVPVFNCPVAPPCDNTVPLPIVGFLQLGIQDIKQNALNPNTVDIDAVILNAAGADPANAPPPPLHGVAGSGASPVAVRLMQ
jgi:hypothetical protein